MKKLVVVTAFVAVALAAHSAAACDWDHQASANAPVDPVVATAAPTTTNTEQTSQGAVSPSTSVASDVSTRKSVDHPAPLLLINERH